MTNQQRNSVVRARAEEALWEDLLLLLEDRDVVPIVGRELLQVESSGGRVSLYTLLAQQVAQQLDVSFDPAEHPAVDPLNLVACRYFSREHDSRRIYSTVYSEAKRLSNLGIPASLTKLAQVRAFDLFLTTTFDRSLEMALNAVRFNGLPRTAVRAFKTTDPEDLATPIRDLPVPTVFHLLGRMSPSPNYVVTEEDALEFIHSLHKSPPQRLFEELHSKHLLVIGCRFPAWLVRSFIRLSRRTRLLQATGSTVFVVDSGAREDKALIEFLRTFKTRTEVFEHGGPVEFVDELFERYRGQADVTGPAVEPTPVALPPQGAIFISYAGADRPTAEAVRQALVATKLEAWFDRDQIMGGDRFMDQIQNGIRRADLFLPILSKNCVGRGEGYFRTEWAAAFDKATRLPNSYHFIFPLVIDDLAPTHEDIPKQLKDLSWFSIAGGLTNEFVEAVKACYQKNQGD